MTATLTYPPVCINRQAAAFVISQDEQRQRRPDYEEYFGRTTESLNAGMVGPSLTMSGSLRPTLNVAIEEIGALTDGWHGKGSKPIPRAIIDRVHFLALSAADVEGLPDPEFTPNAKGTVSLEWESDAGVLYLEVGKTRLNGFLELTGHEPIQIPNVDQVPSDFLNWVAELLYPSQTQPISSNSMTASSVYAEAEAVAV